MIPWDKLHGAMTHFPIALLLFSTACDLVSVTFKKIYRNHIERETEPGNQPLDAAKLAARGRSFFFQSCAHCHGQDADGREDAPVKF
jgi:uncharacterized membrane protein